MNPFRKTAISITISLMIFSLAGPVIVYAKHAVGTNVRDGKGTIYFLSSDGTRRPYSSLGAFKSYGFNNLKSVVKADSEDMSLPEGPKVPPQDGKIICSDRGYDKKTCYLMTSGMKAAFTSSEVFKGQGFNFKNALSGDVSFVGGVGAISSATEPHKPGVLIKKNNTIYLVTENGMFGIPSSEIFKSWGFSYADVVLANAADGISNFPVIDNLRARQPGELSPIPSPFNNFVNNQPVTEVPNAGSYLSASLSGYATQPYPGDKQSELLRVKLRAPNVGTVRVNSLNIAFDGLNDPSWISNLSITRGDTYEEIGRLSGPMTSASIGFGFAPVELSAGQSVDIIARADISKDAAGYSFTAQLVGVSTVTASGNMQIATVIGLPVRGYPVTVRKPANLGVVTSPAGGETWVAGQTYTVRWTGTSASSTVTIVIVPLKPDCGFTGENDFVKCVPDSVYNRRDFPVSKFILTRSTSNTGLFNATVPADWPADYKKVILYVADNAGESIVFSKYFFVSSNAPSLTILSPNGGEVYKEGQSIPVSWSINNIPSGVKIREVYLVDPGGRELFVAGDLPNTGSAVITLPTGLAADQYYLELKTIVGNTVVSDVTDRTIIVSNAGTESRSRDDKRLLQIRQLASALELYFNDNGRYPVALSQLAPKFIGMLPSEPTPADGSCSVSQNLYTYTPKSDGSNYKLTFCLGSYTGGYSSGTHTLSASGVE